VYLTHEGGRVRAAIQSLVVAIFASAGPSIGMAQCLDGITSCTQSVPHLIRFGGVIKNPLAFSHTGVVALQFVVYDDSKGGTALWQEVQNTQTDAEGRYEVFLGATTSDGIPMSLFASGEPRWLGVQLVRPGAEEDPRVLLVSVPYALKAGDAGTLGGLPASAFVRAAQQNAPITVGPEYGARSEASTVVPAIRTGGGSSVPDTSSAPSGNSNVASSGLFNQIPKFSSTGLLNSQIQDSGGVVSLGNLSNILFADRFANGVSDAVAACPENGCIIYALSPKTNLNLGTIDPGTKAITIYLGPYVYTVNQITLRKALKVIGMGAAASGPANGSGTCNAAITCHGTTLQSVNGNKPVFVVPQINNMPVTNILLTGFRVLGSAGNTSEDGFFLDTSTASNMGMWYSTIDDIYMEGFAGVAIHVKGRSNDYLSATQWVLFNNVVVFRTAGGGNALRLEGATFELRFRNCNFDGQGLGDGINIYIGGITGGVSGYPISIVFEGLVSQNAATAVQLDGAYNITFYASHHEILWGGYQILDTHGVGTRGVTITDSYFAGNVGSHAGAGFELDIETTLALGIVFTHNQMYGTPDAIIKSTNLASVAYQDNLFSPGTSDLPPTSGITAQMAPASAMDIAGIHTIGLNGSTTNIVTIRSSLGPGETVTFFTLGGSVVFGSGGNIDLMGMPSVTVNGLITFIRSDLGSLQWKPISQWSPH
jgi:hypothetical protein